MKIKKILSILCVFVLSFVGSKFILDFLNQKIDYGSRADSTSFEDQAIKQSNNEYLILLLGVDKNSSEEDDEDFTRTDTIMLIKANTKDGSIKLLSIPRDSRVKIRDSFDKVNHAHAFGGIDLTLKTLRDFLGLDIDYYVQVNYKALINVVDALGGVDYVVPKGINIDRGSIKIKEGPNHFDGEKTMWYLRTRNIYNNGDIGRVKAQQDFMKSMVDQIVKKSSEINLITLIKNYLSYVKTNLPMPIILDLVKNISKFSSDKVDTMTVPGYEQTIYATSYYLPDVEKTWQIRDEVFGDFRLKNWTPEDSGFIEGKEEDLTETYKGPIENYNEYNYNNSYQEDYNNYYYEEPKNTYVYPENDDSYDDSYIEPSYNNKPSSQPNHEPSENNNSTEQVEPEVEKSEDSSGIVEYDEGLGIDIDIDKGN